MRFGPFIKLGVCPFCHKDIWIDDKYVQDKDCTYYHKMCLENKKKEESL